MIFKTSIFIPKLAAWTIVLLPALAMWIPLGAEIGLLFVLVAMALAWLTGWRPQSSVWGKEQRLIAYAITAMISVKALSTIWSIDPELTLRHLRLHLHLLLFIPLLILFSEVQQKNELFFSKAIPWAIIPGAAWGIWAWIGNGYSFSSLEFSGAAKHPLILSLLLVYIVCNLFFAALQRPLYRHFFLAIIASVIMYMINKRSTTLAMLLTVVFSWWIQNRKTQSISSHYQIKQIPQYIPISIILLATFVLIFFTWSKWILAWQETQQFFSTGAYGGSIDTRWELYSIAIQTFLMHPWIGVGAGTTRHVIEIGSHSQVLAQFNHYHQLFLQLLAEIGVLGFSVWVVSLSIIQRSLNRLVADKIGPIRLTAYTVILIALLFGVTNISFGNILFHIMFAYLLAIVAAEKRER